MEDAYASIGGMGQGLYKEKGSKFIAHAFPVKTVAQVEQHLVDTRKKYYDARHVCYAWRLGKDGKPFRANDDGEPSHSAGDPILNEIKSLEMSDVLVAVVRYFGGVKLGVGGLIRAYGTAGREALEDAPRIEVVLSDLIEIRFPYDRTSEVNKAIHPFRLQPETSNYGLDVQLIYRVRSSKAEQVRVVFRELGVLVEPEED